MKYRNNGELDDTKMPPKETTVKGTLYLNGKKLMDIDGEIPTLELEPAIKPVGDLHSVPHYRCGLCYRAVVVYVNDPKPDRCPWCGIAINW